MAKIRNTLTLLVGAAILGFAPQAAAKTHTVAKGHSLWSIAKRYNVTVDGIRELNGLKKGDPIKPGQKLEIPEKGKTPKKRKSNDKKDDKKDDKSKESKSDKPTKTPWWKEKPPAWTQVQKTAKSRGVNPCNTKDPGWGIYTKWDRAPTVGQMIMPVKGGTTRSGQFDLMVHFHGHDPVRKEWVKVMNGTVLVGIDLGIGSGPYQSSFRSQKAFENLIKSVEARMASHTGKKRARVRKLGLSAWSAGYGAVDSILRTSYGKKNVDVVVLLDGMHSGWSTMDKQLSSFVDYARTAARRQNLMFVSHSAIIPPGYASTWETANFVIHKLGGKPRRTKPRRGDPMGLDLISRYTRGNFHVRGYTGNDKMDHCAHIGLYKDVLKVHVKRRWNSPRGRK